MNYGNTSFFQTTLNGVPFGGAPFHCYPAGWIVSSSRQSQMASTYGQNHPDHDRWGMFTDLGRAGVPVPLSIIVVADGTSNTFMLSEVIQGQGNDLRGFSWWGGASGFTTWSSPNPNEPDVVMGGICNVPATYYIPCTTISTPTRPRMMAARSKHAGYGVNATMCDASSTFIKNNIDIQVWRGLSTSKGGELVQLE